MSKAILEFNLPEEQLEFEQAVNASKYSSVLWDLDQYLRGQVKYPAEKTHEEFIDAMAKVRDELWKLLDEHNITLD